MMPQRLYCLGAADASCPSLICPWMQVQLTTCFETTEKSSVHTSWHNNSQTLTKVSNSEISRCSLHGERLADVFSLVFNPALTL